MANMRYRVITPIEGKDGKTYYPNCGSAWVCKDGAEEGFNIVLDSAPINGKLLIRKPFEDDNPRKRKSGRTDEALLDAEMDDEIPF